MVKRKRPLLKSCCEQEEVEAKSGDRKLSSRLTKRAKALHVNGNKGDGKKKIEDDGVTKKENGIWFVTCEKKAGIMDIEKLKRGENCIKCNGLWFTPPAFEEFAGRGACKKWKVSIFHEGRPLTHWFTNGILSTTGYQRRGNEPMQPTKKLPRKEESCPKESVRLIQGVRRSKYKRSSTSVPPPKKSSRGRIPTKKQPTEDPGESGVKRGSKHYDNSAQFLKTDQGHTNGSDETHTGQTINSMDAEDGMKDDDPNQKETDNEGVSAAADHPKDQAANKESHPAMDIAKARKQKMKTKVVIRRLSMRRRACKAKEDQKDVCSEPLEECVHSGETEIDSAVSEDVGEENVKELNSSENPGSSSTQLNNTDDTCLSDESQNLLLVYVHKDTEEAKLEHDKAKLETSGTGIQISECFHAPETVECQPSGVSGGCDVDAMDLDQLKREKIKMQLKVLRLQEEYYTLMLNDLKK